MTTKEQAREYNLRWYAANKEKRAETNKRYRQALIAWFREYKSTLSCKECGENHPACLSFHHRNPAEKSFSVAEYIGRSVAKQKILDEIAKCDVLCENCHRKLHWEESGGLA